jgi:hypothetical protein
MTGNTVTAWLAHEGECSLRSRWLFAALTVMG